MKKPLTFLGVEPALLNLCDSNVQPLSHPGLLWGEPKEIPEIKEANAAYAIGLFSWKDKKYLSILDLKLEGFYSLEVSGATPEDLENSLMPWAMSLGVDLLNTVVMCDRGG
jgi:hypothetical protein